MMKLFFRTLLFVSIFIVTACSGLHKLPFFSQNVGVIDELIVELTEKKLLYIVYLKEISKQEPSPSVQGILPSVLQEAKKKPEKRNEKSPEKFAGKQPGKQADQQGEKPQNSGLVKVSSSSVMIDSSKIDKEFWRKRTLSELNTYQNILDRLEKNPEFLTIRPKIHEIANYFVIMNGRIQEGKVEKLPQLFQKIETALIESIEWMKNQKK